MRTTYATEVPKYMYLEMFVRGLSRRPGRVAQSVARLTLEPEVPGSIPGSAIYRVLTKSRKENPQKMTQLSSRSDQTKFVKII